MNQWIALQTIVKREITRFMRIGLQTLLPPAITMTLYFIIFGNLIGKQIGMIGDYTYMQFIAPGLVMMSVLNNSYSNTVSSFFSSRFQRSIEEILVSPTRDEVILAGYITGGVCRGLLVGAIVTCIALLFTHLTIHHIFITFITVILAAVLFALAGFTNALFATKFDDISIIPTFIITPLSYFGGVFYSLDMLPPFWHTMSQFNPILYMVNAFRYGILGVSDISIGFAISSLLIFIALLTTLNLWLLKRGKGIRT